MRAPRTVAVVLAAFAALGVLAAAGCRGPQAAPATRAPAAGEAVVVERLGALEVLEHTWREPSGDSGRLASARQWSLRWQGRPLEIHTRGGLFGDRDTAVSRANAVFVVGAPGREEIIVSVGDPNNSSAFHALRPAGGALATPLLCVALSGASAVRWLDGPSPRGQYPGPRLERLAGGRMLGLGDRCLYDVVSRAVTPVPPPPPESTVLFRLGALGIAPGGRSVAYGALRRGAGGDRVFEVATCELDAGRWQTLAVDRERMRYTTLDAIDDAWFDHHFRWQSDAGGGHRLRERERFVPLPRRGYCLSPPAVQYTIEDTVEGARTALVDFVVQRFGARRLPPRPYQDPRFIGLSLRDEQVVVTDTSVHVTPASRYFPGKPGDPELQRRLVREIGDALDAEFAAGRLSEVFGASDRRP